jgi:hypothetical protein
LGEQVSDKLIERPSPLYPRIFTHAEAGHHSERHQYRLECRREEAVGNVYYEKQLDLEGWLCPALFKYIEKAPNEIFIQARKLEKSEV